MVQGAHRQHAENDAGTGQRGSNRVDRAVPATGDDNFMVFVQGTLAELGYFVACSGNHRYRQAMGGKQLGNLAGSRFCRWCACRLVEDAKHG